MSSSSETTFLLGELPSAQSAIPLEDSKDLKSKKLALAFATVAALVFVVASNHLPDELQVRLLDLPSQPLARRLVQLPPEGQ